jgi:hypothetical protein
MATKGDDMKDMKFNPNSITYAVIVILAFFWSVSDAENSQASQSNPDIYHKYNIICRSLGDWNCPGAFACKAIESISRDGHATDLSFFEAVHHAYSAKMGEVVEIKNWDDYYGLKTICEEKIAAVEAYKASLHEMLASQGKEKPDCEWVEDDDGKTAKVRKCD